MPFARKLVLHCPNGVPMNMEALARQFIVEGVKFVAAVGPECRLVEGIIDKVAIAHGSPERNFILTTSHPHQTLEEAIEFACSLDGEYEGDIEVVEL